uniref:Uncharacterized protein n=1 Tax=Cavia porcellus TaxID=10141 RepID=A0A286XXC9_CAVPO
MRLLPLSSLLCILLLCVSVFFGEGNRTRLCEPCKYKLKTAGRWVVPGALPQV